MRFQSVILLPAVIGLELPGFTLVRQWRTLLGLRPFAFLLLLIHRSLEAPERGRYPLSKKKFKMASPLTSSPATNKVLSCRRWNLSYFFSSRVDGSSFGVALCG